MIPKRIGINETAQNIAVCSFLILFLSFVFAYMHKYEEECGTLQKILAADKNLLYNREKEVLM